MLVTVILPPISRPDQLRIDRHSKFLKCPAVASETPSRRNVFLISVNHRDTTMPHFEEQFGSQKTAVELIWYNTAYLSIARKTIHQHERKTKRSIRHLYGSMVRCRKNDPFHSTLERNFHGRCFNRRIAIGIKC